MKHSLYQAFQRFDFRNDKCFLSGSPENTLMIDVLPEWLMKMANYSGHEKIKLLDESIKEFKDLRVPIHPQCFSDAVAPLDFRIAQAFEKGYAAVLELPELDLFHWMGKLLYGMFYVEMESALRQGQLSNKGNNMSQKLMFRFNNLHFMLQGLFRPLQYEGFKPWSIVVVPLQEKNMHFAFRDELNSLSFSVKFKDFGIVASLQDNGYGLKYHHELLKQIQGQALTDVQFEELSARFFYSSYLLNRVPEYHIFELDEVVYIDAMPLEGMQAMPIFDVWKHDIYGQVLANFWEFHGITKFEIAKDPQSPLSFFEPPLLPQEVI